MASEAIRLGCNTVFHETTHEIRAVSVRKTTCKSKQSCRNCCCDHCRCTGEDTKQRSLASCDGIFTSFSTTFCLTLTSTLLGHLGSGGCHEQQLWSRLIGTDSTLAPDLDLKPTEKLVSAEKLWQGIVANLKKGAEARSTISVSSQLLSCLMSRAEDSAESNNLEQPGCAVLFTCGHQFAQKAFVETVVPELEDSLTRRPQPLTHTATLLKRYYHREGCYPMACPRCVLSAVKQLWKQCELL